MQVAPVIWLIKLIIANERRISTSPIIAKVKVFLAPSTCFGSPPEVRNLIPAKKTKKRATTPASPKSQLSTKETITGMQLNVAAPFSTQFPQVIDRA